MLDVLFPVIEDTYEGDSKSDKNEVDSDTSDSDGSLGTVGIVVIIVVIVAILILGVVTYFIIRKCKSETPETFNSQTGPRDIQASSIIYMPNHPNVQRNRFEITDIGDESKEGKEPIKGIPVGAPTDAHTLHVIENQEPEFVLAEVAENDESESECQEPPGDVEVQDLDNTSITPPS